MRINFNEIESSEIRNYKNGQGPILSKIVLEGNKKIMVHKIESGSTIGYHVHEICTEIIYILNGVATILEDDGESYKMNKGEMLIVKPEIGHGIRNDGEEDLDILCIVYK